VKRARLAGGHGGQGCGEISASYGSRAGAAQPVTVQTVRKSEHCLEQASRLAAAMEALAELLGESPAINALREKLRHLLEGQPAGRRLPPILIQG